jgi:SAM-dependent methyltransferase
LMQKYFTFQDRGRSGLTRQSVSYAVFQVWNLGLNTLLMYVGVDLLGVPYLLSQLLIGTLLAVSSYLIFKHVLFKESGRVIAGLACPVCDGRTQRVFGQKNGYDLAQCADCRLIFVYPLSADTTAIYDEAYFTGGKEYGYADYDRDKEPMRRTFEAYLDRVEAELGRKGRLLDVGCATGYFIDLARSHGWEAEGVELSPHASAVGRAKGLAIHTGTLESVTLPAKSFDAVTIFDVIEHVSDPAAVLSRASELLAEDGIIAVSTPDASSMWARMLGVRWHLVVPPEHLILFGRRNFVRLLEDAGYTPSISVNIGKRFTLPYIFQTLARWQGLAIWDWLARVTNKGPLSKLSVPINMRDTFFMIAVKQRTP